MERIREAREALPQLSFDDAVHAQVSTLCIAAAVDGLRADLVMLRAARALAAWELADAVTTQHVDCVAEAVLVHRRREQRESSASGSRAPDTQAQSRDVPADSAGTPQASAGGGEGEGEGEGDWGYLPPQPAAIRHVKGVIPLDVKKR